MDPKLFAAHQLHSLAKMLNEKASNAIAEASVLQSQANYIPSASAAGLAQGLSHAANLCAQTGLDLCEDLNAEHSA